MDELVAQVNHDEPPPHSRANAGWVEVIAGSMFSGKSEELIRRLRRAKIARQKVQVFKPELDSRFSENQIVSHSEMRHESANSRSAAEILAKIDPDTEVVGIDEGQFFDNELVFVANELANRGVRVIGAEQIATLGVASPLHSYASSLPPVRVPGEAAPPDRTPLYGADLLDAVARFSVMAADLAGLFQEIDGNPVLCGAGGAFALDALVVPKPGTR